MTTTDQYLPIIYQHDAEAGGAIPPQIMTIYTYEAARYLEISTRSISDAEGFVTAICKTDHAGRLSGRLPMGLALLGEMDAEFYYGRISGLSISTDCDFGELTEQWQRAGSGGYALIFVLRPATARSDETVAMIAVDLQTFGHDGLAAHGRPKEVCLFEGLPPKKIEKNNSSALETFTKVTSALTGRGRAAAAQMEGVRRYSSSACNALAITLAVQGQSINWQRGVWQTEITHQTGTGERIWCSLQSTGWVTMLVCSSNVRVAGTHNRRLLLPLHGLPHHPCWEARFSGRGGLARPASCLVSGCYLLARRRGTPGSGIQSSVPPQRMDRQSIVVLRGDAAVLVDWILTSEAAYPQITNRLIDARFDTMPLGWALFCGYVGANFTFWMHSKRSQQQEGHRLSWKSLAGGRPSATPASYLVSGSHPVAWVRDPSLWYFCCRPAPQELMSAEASSLEHRLEYGGQL